MEKMMNMFIMNYIHQWVAWNIKEQCSCHVTSSLQYMNWYNRALYHFLFHWVSSPNTHFTCLCDNCRRGTWWDDSQPRFWREQEHPWWSLGPKQKQLGWRQTLWWAVTKVSFTEHTLLRCCYAAGLQFPSSPVRIFPLTFKNLAWVAKLLAVLHYEIIEQESQRRGFQIH